MKSGIEPAIRDEGKPGRRRWERGAAGQCLGLCSTWTKSTSSYKPNDGIILNNVLKSTAAKPLNGSRAARVSSQESAHLGLWNIRVPIQYTDCKTTSNKIPGYQGTRRRGSRGVLKHLVADSKLTKLAGKYRQAGTDFAAIYRCGERQLMQLAEQWALLAKNHQPVLPIPASHGSAEYLTAIVGRYLSFFGG